MSCSGLITVVVKRQGWERKQWFHMTGSRVEPSHGISVTRPWQLSDLLLKPSGGLFFISVTGENVNRKR